MKRPMVVLTLLVIALVVTSPWHVSAQTQACDTTTVDDAGVFGSKLQEVNAKAIELNSLGADMRVRTIKSFGSAGTLDKYSDNILQVCPSWQNPTNSGNYKSNLIVVMVSVGDRKTGIFYSKSGEWGGLLDRNQTRIQTDFMNTKFPSGAYADGFTGGMGEIQRLIKLQLNPPTSVPPVQQQVQPSPVPPPPVIVQVPAQPSQPVDMSWLVTICGWAIALVAFGGAGYLAIKFGSGYFAEREKRSTAQQKAKLAKQSAADAIANWPDLFNTMQSRLNTLRSNASNQDVNPLLDRLAEAKRVMDNASVKYSGTSSSAGNPDNNLSAGQYDAIEQAYQSVNKLLDQAQSILSEIGTKADTLERIISEGPKVLAAAQAKIDESAKTIQTISGTGLKTVDANSSLAQARAAITEAITLIAQKSFTQAGVKAEAAKKLAEQAVTSAKAVAENKRKAEHGENALSARIEQTKISITSGRATFVAIAAAYAKSSWQSITGNGTESENRINWAMKANDAINAQIANQEWTNAQNGIDQANTWLDQADSFMRSVTALKQNLEKAKQTAQSSINSAQAQIDKATAYIQKHDENVKESLEVRLAADQKSLAQAKEELQNEKPDYLLVLKLATDARKSADDILAEAQNQNETILALQTKIGPAKVQADAAVSKASEYIEDHSRDTSRSTDRQLEHAKASLSEAETQFAKAQRLEDDNRQMALKAGLSAYEEAKSLANDAFRKAKSDVSEAEESRRPRYTPSDNVIVTTPTWGSSSSWPRQDHYSGGRSSGSSSRRDDSDSGGGSIPWSLPSSPSRRDDDSNDHGGSSTSWSAPSHTPSPSPSRSDHGGSSTGW